MQKHSRFSASIDEVGEQRSEHASGSIPGEALFMTMVTFKWQATLLRGSRTSPAGSEHRAGGHFPPARAFGRCVAGFTFAGLIHINKPARQRFKVTAVMNRLRHRRLRTRFAILAIVALLWSQALLAGHPACSMAAMALAEISVPAPADADCHHPAPASEQVVCGTHCSQGNQTNDVGRVPPIPLLVLPMHGDFWSIVFVATHDAPLLDLPPPVSWHRPTPHPANLLLI